jgi:hypothetical protein
MRRIMFATMNRHEGREQGGAGRIAVITLLVVSAVIIGILAGRFVWKPRDTGSAPGSQAFRADSTGAGSHQPIPGESRGGEAGRRSGAGAPAESGDGRRDEAAGRGPDGEPGAPAGDADPRLRGATAQPQGESRGGSGGDPARSGGARRGGGYSDTSADLFHPETASDTTPPPPVVAGGVVVSPPAYAQPPSPASRGGTASASPAPSPASQVSPTQTGAAATAQGDGTSAPGTTPPPVDDPASDRVPPSIVSLQFDPPEIADGNATTLLIHATDNLSGVRSVSGNVRSPSGTAVLHFQALDTGGGMFAASIMIPGKAEAGIWSVFNLTATDGADNSLIEAYSAATLPAGGSLKVVSTESDSTAPEVRGIQVEKPTVSAGEKNTIRIDAVDDRSGTASVTGAFQSPSKSALIYFSCRAGSDPETWESEFPIPANADCGVWTLQQLQVADKAGNIAYLTERSPQLSHVDFNVSSDNCDSTPPTIDSLTLSPNVVSNENPSEILVTATVHDEGSGAISMYGWATGPASTNGQVPRVFFSCVRDPSSTEGIWTGKISMPKYAASGTWTLSDVRVQDKALNTRYYNPQDPVIAQNTFRVQ